MRNKIAGSLYGAAIGDAMGAVTEGMSAEQILDRFGEEVTGFLEPLPETPSYGRVAGQVTDAFSIPYFFLQELGICAREEEDISSIAEKALMHWGKSEYFEPFAGMTTRKVISRLNSMDKIGDWDYAGHLGNKLFKSHYYALSSNGAATKAFPAGLLSRGNVDTAIKYAMEISLSSHDDPYSISGACAVAAAVSEALNSDSSTYKIVQAGLYGAKQGESLARQWDGIFVYPGPSVLKRIEMAIEIGLHAGDSNRIMQELRDKIGCGPAIAETVPASFGILIAAQAKTMECIIRGVNIGDETSAVASIVGGISGCFRGVESLPEDYRDMVERQNGFDFKKLEKIIMQK